MIKVTITSNDENKITRIILTDKAFNILWDIDQVLRNRMKHGTLSDESYSICEEVRNTICESGLMEFYT